MKQAPVIVFACNRPVHLRRTLEALAANDLACETDVVIFCDGPRYEVEKPLADAVYKVAAGARGFKSCTVSKRDAHLGLTYSVIEGVDEALAKNDRVIIMEDDLLASPYFLRFMNEALRLYIDEPKVSCVSGRCFPHSVSTPPESFFLPGSDCAGWATWKRAWQLFEKDGTTLARQLGERRLGNILNRGCGCDCMSMLQDSATGRVGSWSAHWLATALLNDMYYLVPGRSLVLNIGNGDSDRQNTRMIGRYDAPLSQTPVRLEKQPVRAHPVMYKALMGFLSGSGGDARRKHAGPLRNKVAELQYAAKATVKRVFSMMGLRKKKKETSGRNVWQRYPDWQSACAASGGYDSEAIFQRVRLAARMVRDGSAVWERDSVPFYHEEYTLPLLAALMKQAACNKGRLSVLDFGGALGSTYMQNRAWLDCLDHLEWHVVEQPHFVACGKEEFTFGPLRFWPTMAECFQNGAIDVVLLSGVLQYLDEPYALLEEVCSFAPSLIVIERTPFAEGEEEFSVQHVPEHIYKASYACRFLDRRRCKDVLQRQGYRCLPEYPSAVDPKGFFGFFALRQ
ncbi:methyltransferase, TIGR04325 family [Desulfovibrio sp. OttesenSCG-928-G15]|nr:methyltransferase, TIGR04325 family [Desulfovibrio sp. OttesenSCG-928-G15]